MTVNSDYLSALPTDVLGLIANKLPVKDMKALRCVNKKVNEALNKSNPVFFPMSDEFATLHLYRNFLRVNHFERKIYKMESFLRPKPVMKSTATITAIVALIVGVPCALAALPVIGMAFLLARRTNRVAKVIGFGLAGVLVVPGMIALGLTYVAVNFVVRAIFGGLQALFGMVQTVGALGCAAYFRAKSVRGNAIAKENAAHALRHVKHGLGNMAHGILNTIPLVGEITAWVWGKIMQSDRKQQLSNIDLVKDQNGHEYLRVPKVRPNAPDTSGIFEYLTRFGSEAAQYDNSLKYRSLACTDHVFIKLEPGSFMKRAWDFVIPAPITAQREHDPTFADVRVHLDRWADFADPKSGLSTREQELVHLIRRHIRDHTCPNLMHLEQQGVQFGVKVAGI